jgi:hypothetical protein
MEKRKSAANIFMEQQALPIEEEKDTFYNAETNLPAGGVLSKNDAPSYQQKKQKQRNYNFVNIKTSEELQLEKEAIKVRITGFGFWKRVIVPPNAYVIHTRIGRKEPVTIGLGVSFRYNPNKDAYMIIPAAMQTIGVVANCITKEKQGINILAYLQWQIDDFAVAYKKLDFSELRDPLGIVNAQLREQAEAAIKDKIATMSVEEVLTDKAPVIKELTSRLKTVAEGQSSHQEKADEGLGIKITTVQIREAIVSSETLWTDLQSPFRNEQRKKSRISFLDTENEIRQKEFDSKLLIETGESKTNLEIELLRQKKMTEMTEIRYKEEGIRFTKEQENIQHRTNLEEQTNLLEKESADRLVARENEINYKREIENINIRTTLEESKLKFEVVQIEQQAELQTKRAELKLLEENQKIAQEKLEYIAILDKQKTEHDSSLKIDEEKRKLEAQFDIQKMEIEKMRMEIQNLKNNQVLFSELIRELPKIAAEMPKADELKIIQTGNDDNMMNSLTNFISKITSIGESLGINLTKK